ncbi:unnamed protein product [Blepharisma stoltei]|uniref:ATP synthase F(1) sector subunit delta n=1 Tax=Blepharisma stoltei TaxID=1481888 RepID=A0AAU9JI92_9CILI|nr:unnamed protein product [Blepharisma stoltei]
MITKVFRRFSLLSDRYAQTIFKAAGEHGEIEKVSEDMKFITELHNTSPEFKAILVDPTIKKTKVNEILEELGDKANFTDTTKKLIQLLLVSKRLFEIPDIAKSFENQLKEREKKETVKVVSATPLSDTEKLDVQKALQDHDKTKKYELSYDVDPSILGGLQLYYPTAFMDLSLRSRLAKIKEEVGNLAV